MPTKKKRVGFIPRNDVLDIIKKLSFESNLSNSKIINILVEEALQSRGFFNNKNGKNVIITENSKILKSKEGLENNKNGSNHGFVNNYSKNENLKNQEHFIDTLDLEIYKKFLIFLQFEKEMKKNNN